MTALCFGMPTLIELSDMAANIDICRRLGLNFVELNMDLPACQPELLPAEQVRTWRDNHAIDFTVHMPERLDLAAFQRNIRNGQVACVKSIIDWASRAGIGKLTMHMNPGVYFTLPQQRVWLYRQHRPTYMANLLESMDEIVPCAARVGVTLLIENTGEYGQDFLVEAVEGLLSRYDTQVGLTWDVGHDAESGYKDSPFIRRHLDRVAHMHLHNFDGKSAHQPLLTGSVDILAMIDVARQHQANVVIETKTVQSLTASVGALKARGIM